jgi:AsmA protein
LKRPAKFLLALTGAIVLVLTAAAVALPLLVDAEALRARAEASLSKALERKVTLGAASISLWTGLRLRAAGLRIGEPLTRKAAGVPVLEAGPTSVRVAILPLLRGRIDARSVAIDGAAVLQDGRPLLTDLSVRSAVRVEPGGAIEADARMTTKLSLLGARPVLDARGVARLAGGRLDVSRLDATIGPLKLGATGRVSGVSSPAPSARFDLAIDMERSRVTGPLEVVLGAGAPSGRFDLTSQRLDLGELAALPSALAGTTAPAVPKGIELTGVTARVRMEHGAVSLDDARFSAFGGQGRASVTAHPFEHERAFTVDEAVQGVSIGALIAALAPAQKGSVEGTATLNASLRGRAGGTAILPTLSGSGSLAVRDGTIKSVGVIQQVMKLLETAGATGIAKDETPFDRLTADFAVAEGVASTRNLEFRSTDLNCDGRGTVGLGGALDLDVMGSFSPAVSGQLVAKTHALSMRVDENGRLTVPLQIRGTMQAPRVQLDLNKVIQEGVVKEMKKEGTKNLLKKLFGR